MRRTRAVRAWCRRTEKAQSIVRLVFQGNVLYRWPFGPFKETS